MPKDGSATRERILEEATAVFNERGFWGTSLSALLAATGLEKGGLYHHFGSKEALALEAFDHAVDVLRQRIRAALDGVREAGPRVERLVETYVDFVLHPPYPGGCPLLNTAVESDDTHPPLRDRARAAVSELLDGTVARILQRGVERGELRADLDVAATATFVVAALEGGVMLTKLYADAGYMHRTAEQIVAHVRGASANGATR